MADFEKRHEEFARRGATVVGASADAFDDAQRTVERLALRMPLAYGLDAREFSTLTGAFFSDEKSFVHATGFVIDRDGRVVALTRGQVNGAFLDEALDEVLG